VQADDLISMASPDRLLNEIIFLRPPDDNSAIVIVEGDSDVKLFKNFVYNENYVLQPVSLIDIDEGRKVKVIETIKKANEEGIKGVIGIIDADFDNLTDCCSEENLYRTDTHDLESMLLRSKKALKKILSRYDRTDHLISDTELFEIQEILLESSKYIGYALWCSNEYKWMITFKNFPINECINDRCELDLDCMCEMLINKSTNITMNKENIKVEIYKKVSEGWDLWQVCRGKEMLRVLAHYIKNNIKKASLNHDNLKEDLILAFDRDDFMNTSLYFSLKKWQDQNKNYLLINL
jgi:hypothetical protein